MFITEVLVGGGVLEYIILKNVPNTLSKPFNIYEEGEIYENIYCEMWQESYDEAVSLIKYQDGVYILKQFKHKCK